MKLLKKEQLKSLVRAHQLQQQGYKFHTWNGPNEFPPCITIFSAPNYCASDNDAAVMITEGDNVDVRTFAEKKDKPFCLPERPDAFQIFWPRMTSHILECVHLIMKFVVCESNSEIAPVLKRTSSIDSKYIQRVIAHSKKSLSKEDQDKLEDAAKILSAKPKDELSELEDDLDIDDLDQEMGEHLTAAKLV